jgi:hypothetical protein
LLAESADWPSDEFTGLRSHRPARTVNRNEPFGSILETANSHFSKLLTVFDPAAGRIRCAERRVTTGERLGSRHKSWPVRFSPMVSRRMDAMSLSCRWRVGRRD